MRLAGPAEGRRALSASSVLVIGGGPAGLAAALELSRAGLRVEVVERERRVGGLARTHRFREGRHLFLTDNGPHRFFSRSPRIRALVGDLVAGRSVHVERHTRQLVGGQFYDYPIRPLQALGQAGPRLAARIARDYLCSAAGRRLGGRPIETFEDHVFAHFGRTLARFNITNYTEKVWGLPAAGIDPDWAVQRIPGLDLVGALREAVASAVRRRGPATPRTSVQHFVHPHRGTGAVYEAMERELRARGGRVHKGSRPLRILHRAGRVEAVELDLGGRRVARRPEHVIQSVPVGPFVSLLDPPPPPEVLRAAARLRFRAQTYLFLTLDRERVGPDQWTYFPEPDVPFGRMSEMKNFSPAMSPPGKTSLLLEFFCWEGDEVWRLPERALLEAAIGPLERMGFCRRAEVRRAYRFGAPHAYPAYELGYRTHRQRVLDYLDGFGNLLSVGRPGRFRYTNQDHSLEMGLLAARTVLDGRCRDLDGVGAEPECYEESVPSGEPCAAPCA